MQSKPETLNEIETRNRNAIETRNPKSDCNQKYYVHFKPGFGLGQLSYHKGGFQGLTPWFGLSKSRYNTGDGGRIGYLLIFMIKSGYESGLGLELGLGKLRNHTGVRGACPLGSG